MWEFYSCHKPQIPCRIIILSSRRCQIAENHVLHHISNDISMAKAVCSKVKKIWIRYPFSKRNRLCRIVNTFRRVCCASHKRVTDKCKRIKRALFNEMAITGGVVGAKARPASSASALPVLPEIIGSPKRAVEPTAEAEQDFRLFRTSLKMGTPRIQLQLLFGQFQFRWARGWKFPAKTDGILQCRCNVPSSG